MSDSLPERPDLAQLRRQAKELRDAARRGDAAAVDRFVRHHTVRPVGEVSLAAAQLVVARELGFASWPKLKAAVDAASGYLAEASALAGALVDPRRLRQANEIVAADPMIGARSLLAAVVLGDADHVRHLLARDPAAAVAIDEERGWPPLLYACYSRWHHVHPDGAAGLAEVARLLLDAGANPNTNDGGRPRYRSALKGSVEVNNPPIAELLLDAGASPDPGQPIAEAPAHRDNMCLELLLAHGARVARTWALGAAAFHDNAPAMSLLLGALGEGAADAATEELPDATANASLAVVEALLASGADPGATGEDGVSALRLAVRAGRNDTAERLRDLGATDDTTEVDRFIGACLNADRAFAEDLLAEHPDLPDRLTDDDRAVIVDAASSRPAETVALMVELGFSPRARRLGEEPLHTAAYSGNAAVVRVLLAAGAELDARDDRFEATPLAFATVGSGEQAGKPGAWPDVVRVLLDAGASRDEVWLPSKPPSEDVADVLRSYGVAPEAPAEHDTEDDTQVVGSIGTGVMADVARHLEAAYRDRDLDLLGSLLHPDVHWTGLCTNRGQVLDWYRGLLDEGTMPTVQSVEVDRDAVLLGLAVTRPAEGARPAPPQQVYQSFIIEAAQIVDIHGYPDRASALGR